MADKYQHDHNSDIMIREELYIRIATDFRSAVRWDAQFDTSDTISVHIDGLTDSK